MIVFKTFWRLTKKQIFMVLSYFTIFLILSMASYLNYQESSRPGSEQQDRRPLGTIVLLDQSGSENAQIFGRLLETEASVLRQDSEKAARDGVISGYAEAMITLPNDFDERLKAGKDAAEIFANPQNYEAWRTRLYADKLLRFCRVSCAASGKIDENKLEAVLQEKVRTVFPEVKAEQGRWQSRFRFHYFRAASYLMLALVLSVFTQLLTAWFRPEVENRRLASGFSNLYWQGQSILGLFILGTLLSLGLGLGSLLFTGFPEGPTEMIIAAKQLLALFCLAVSGMGMAWLILAVTRKNSLLSILSNVLSLGFAFLSGGFVDRSLIGEKVQRFASLFPPYHYILALEEAEKGSGAYALQVLLLLLFALVYLLLAAILRRSRSRSSLEFAPPLTRSP